jgi:hypothetical protein
VTALAPRDRFRSYALDGALQYFHPRSGTHVRVAGPHTRHVRKTAPRVVMFGITNACNLACRFCSRDPRRDSRWTVDSAFEVLRDLSDAGVLEVAFGGGEPFAFPEFGALIARLHEETPLALNVTTNGTLLDGATWAAFAGRLGQVRVSLYGDTVWRRCAELFATTGQRWGANILVDDAACATLASTLADLAAAGCHDVSLLGYVGEPARVLSPRGRRELADIALASPLPCRVSVCFGASLDVPRLMAGFDNDGDCGAGSDFITVTPDQRVQSCSFQDAGFPGTTAAEILCAWRSQREALARPSPRSGCARHLEQIAPAPLPEIAIWQGFSGNNSGECVMVAKFQTVDDARAYLDELVPSWRSWLEADQGDDWEIKYPPAWEELFAREQVAGAAMKESERWSPGDIVQVGRGVLVSGYGLGDTFPELRALAWKRGARVLPGGIHVHESVEMFAAIGARDDADRAELERAAELAGMPSFIHGRTVFVHVASGDEDSSLSGKQARLVALSAGRPVAAELLWEEWTKDDVVDALQHLGHEEPERPRLWIQFRDNHSGTGHAQAFADTLSDQTVTVGPNWLLIDPVQGRKRVAVLAYRRDAVVTTLDAERIKVGVTFWRPRTARKEEPEMPMPTLTAMQGALKARGVPGPDDASVEWTVIGDNVSLELLTAQPGRVLNAAETVAVDQRVDLWSVLSEPYPMRAMLRRLRAEVG